MSNAKSIIQALKGAAEPDRVRVMERYFKTGPGCYAEGDRFLGVRVPRQRLIAREGRALEMQEIAKLLQSPWHEARLTAVFILVDRFRRTPDQDRGPWVEFYVEHLDRINNWDLVDSSAPKILGKWILEDRSRIDVLDSLAASGKLWRERVSILALQPIIADGDFRYFLCLAKRFLRHPHDLIHKAVGWMLRELGSVDADELYRFLDRHAANMPRTMLRYAIEKIPKSHRDHFMNRRA